MQIPLKADVVKKKKESSKKQRISALKKSAEVTVAKGISQGRRRLEISMEPQVQSHIIKLLKDAGWTVKKVEEPKTCKYKYKGKTSSYERTIHILEIS